MKTITKKTTITLAAFLITILYGCNSLNTTEPEISEQELEVAGEIIAQSLSEQQGGVLSSVYDAFSNISQSAITYSAEGQTVQKPAGDSSGSPNRGAESEYTASFNPDTGEHTISFNRSFEGPNLTKNLSVVNRYIFADNNQNFLQWPKRQQDQIETIDFKGMRTGSAVTQRRTSSFTRNDSFFASGISGESTVLTLDGRHEGQGVMSVDLPRLERSGERSYEVLFEFQNIQIDKSLVRENGSLEEGITGLINYQIEMTRTKDGNTDEKNLTGTIELTGDGSALLRFKRFSKTLLISMRNGTIMQ